MLGAEVGNEAERSSRAELVWLALLAALGFGGVGADGDLRRGSVQSDQISDDQIRLAGRSLHGTGARRTAHGFRRKWTGPGRWVSQSEGGTVHVLLGRSVHFPRTADRGKYGEETNSNNIF